MTGPASSVTVIAPCYNAAHQLDSFLDRLTATLVPGVQVILVDDASTDGTAEILERWSSPRDDSRLIRLETNGGVAAARNRALAETHSDYVWFVDVDDEWEPDIVTVLEAQARSSGADIVVCRALYRGRRSASGRVIDGLSRRELVSSAQALEKMAAGELHGFLWNKLLRRRILQNDLFPRLSSQSDFVGVLRAVQTAERVLFIPDVLYSYIHTVSSITRRRDPDLSNLLACSTAMHDALDRHFGVVPVALSDWFTTWFYAVPVALTPIRQNADPALVRTGIRLGSAALQGVGVLRSSRHPRLLVLGLVLKHAPVVFAVFSRALYTVHDTHRRLVPRRSSST